VRHAEPKSKSSEGTAASAMMGQVCRQLRTAFQHVAANKGAPGPDRQSIEEVREHLPDVLSALEAALISGTYCCRSRWLMPRRSCLVMAIASLSEHGRRHDGIGAVAT
jgi:glutathione S-transferase